MSEFKNGRKKELYFLIGIPVLCYVLFQTLILGNISAKAALIKVLPIIYMVSIVAFIFFCVRIVQNRLKEKKDIGQKYLAVVVLLGSLMGLALNEALGNIFGDFSHYIFYVFAILTGVLMMIQKVENEKARIFLFVGKCITYIFTLYFFIVFLPLIPLSFIGIIFAGAGLLMLVPLALMYLHTRLLWIDFNDLKSFYKKRVLAAIFLIGLLVIPSLFMMTIRGDKKNLDQALKYTYQRSFEDDGKVNISLSGIERVLTNIKYMKGMNRDKFDMFTTKIPYITSFYDSYVLENYSISKDKIKKLEEVFFGESEIEFEEVNHNNSKDVSIKNIKTETEFDSKKEVYRSWIHFEIENDTDFQNEFSTVFEIPEGSYISNYYLYVGDEKKQGLIADKRAANWIYEEAKKVKRDPGILTYIGGHEVSFKIFPFEGNEKRKTGIAMIHKTPVKIHIDGREVNLHDSNFTQNINVNKMKLHPGIAYISKEEKDTFQKIKRPLKYYFIMDYSKGNEKKIDDYKKRVKDYIEQNNIKDSVEEIIALNFYENRIPYDENWEENLKDFETKGGFFLEYTIKKILYDNYVHNAQEQSVIVLVTDDPIKNMTANDLADVQFASPEGLYCYHLDRNERLVKYSLFDSALNDVEKYIDKIDRIPVLVWKNEEGKTFYLADDKENSIVMIDDDLEMVEKDLKKCKWENGVILKGMYMSYMLHPEKYFEKSLSIVKGSILSKVMTPLTSYIVLENEAQEKAMLAKQKEILSTEKPIDIGDLTKMDEPSLIWMFLIFVVFILYKKRIV